MVKSHFEEVTDAVDVFRPNRAFLRGEEAGASKVTSLLEDVTGAGVPRGRENLASIRLEPQLARSQQPGYASLDHGARVATGRAPECPEKLITADALLLNNELHDTLGRHSLARRNVPAGVERENAELVLEVLGRWSRKGRLQKLQQLGGANLGG